MTKNIQTPAADIYAQMDIHTPAGDECVVFDLPDFESSTRQSFAPLLPAVDIACAPLSLPAGYYPVSLYITARGESFTYAMSALTYLGTMTIDAQSRVTALDLDDQPYMMDGCGEPMAISSEHAAAWSSDIQGLHRACEDDSERADEMDEAFNSERTGIKF